MSPTSLIDDGPLTAFHKRLTVFSAGGPFLDGYALTIIGIALVTMKPQLGLSTVDVGLIGAAALGASSSVVSSSGMSPTGSAARSCTSLT